MPLTHRGDRSQGRSTGRSSARLKELKRRQCGVNVLARIGPEAATAVPKLIELLKNDTVATVQVAAAVALGAIGPQRPECVAALMEVIGAAPSNKIRDAAADSLVGIAVYNSLAAQALIGHSGPNRLTRRIHPTTNAVSRR